MPGTLSERHKDPVESSTFRGHCTVLPCSNNQMFDKTAGPIRIAVMNNAFVIVGVVAFVLTPPAAWGQCVTFDKPEDFYRLSDAVFVGTVIRNAPTGAKGSHEMVDVATLRLERSWKGVRSREVRVASDVALESQKKYLVFAGGNPLSTSVLCRWTEPIDEAKAKLDWLSKRRSRLPK